MIRIIIEVIRLVRWKVFLRVNLLPKYSNPGFSDDFDSLNPCVHGLRTPTIILFAQTMCSIWTWTNCCANIPRLVLLNISNVFTWVNKVENLMQIAYNEFVYSVFYFQNLTYIKDLDINNLIIIIFIDLNHNKISISVNLHSIRNQLISIKKNTI